MHAGLIATLCLVSSIATSGTSATAQQAPSFADLEGHSIISDYREMIHSPRFGSFGVTWRDRIYFSTKGRIFHRLDILNPLRGANQRREFVSGEGGQSEGRGTPFRWTGDGLSREWTDLRGLRFRQSVSITGSGGRYGCVMSLERYGSRALAEVVHRSCRVIKGNAVS